MKTAALILAAGTTDRSEDFRPLHKVGSVSAVQRLILTFQRAGADPIVLVARTTDKLSKHVGRRNVVLLQNEAPSAQMLDSAKTGLAYLQGKCEQVLITPVDIPLFSVDTVQALMSSGHKLAVPACGGKSGHPLLVAEELFPHFLTYGGTDGLRGAMNDCGCARDMVEVEDPGVLLNVERGGDFEEVIAGHSMQQLRPECKLRLAKDVGFFGPGTRRLLKLIESTGSVRLACGQLGMSYSKAWKVLALVEEQLGYTVVARQQGGKSGGAAHLTERGKVLLERYEQFEQECQTAVNQVFHKYF